MKPLTRSLTAFQVERMAIGVRKVVSSTIKRLKPSTPIWKDDISACHGDPGQVDLHLQLRLCGLNRASTHSERPKVTREVSQRRPADGVFLLLFEEQR